MYVTTLLSVAFLLLVVVPFALVHVVRLDAAPRLAIAWWMATIVVGGWSLLCSCVVAATGLSDRPAWSDLRRLIDLLVSGHPLRGLGFGSVVALSIAVDIIVVLIGGVAFGLARSTLVRRRHRALIDLVGDTQSPSGPRVLASPTAVAYYVPGRGGRVVVSRGAQEALTHREMSAVVAHEYGHHFGHHSTLGSALSGLAGFGYFIPAAYYGPREIMTFLEMAADDYAARRTSRAAVSAALSKAMSFARAPSCSYAVNDVAMTRRQNRLDHVGARRPTVWAPALVALGATLALSALATLA